MNAKRKQRLLLVVLVLLGSGVAVSLAMFSLGQNINLFFTPSEIAMGEAPADVRVRVGGVVVEGSVQRDTDSLKVRFDVTDYQNAITVEYDGILPDLFREGQGIVAQGRLDGEGMLMAKQVLAKHDENYMAPEVAEALARAGKMPGMITPEEKDY